MANDVVCMYATFWLFVVWGSFQKTDSDFRFLLVGVAWSWGVRIGGWVDGLGGLSSI